MIFPLVKTEPEFCSPIPGGAWRNGAVPQRL